MSTLFRNTVLILLCTLVAAAVGGWLGVHYGLREESQESRLHQVLHHDLRLSSEQEQAIASLEASFDMRRTALEASMRAANEDLAQAITVRHLYDPEARQAVERFHAAMMELQDVTIEHVLAMRKVLTPGQVEQFDRTINSALTIGPP